MRHQIILISLALGMGRLGVSAYGQIPTTADRIRDSGLNPEYNTWRAQALYLSPKTPPTENEPPLIAGFRKDFFLAAPPREAAITLLLPEGNAIYRFRANGRLVAETRPIPTGKHVGLRNLDLTAFLQAGRNVIAFDVETRGHTLMAAEGLVFTKDGGMVRLLTDATWKGGLNLPAGWDRPETDPDTLPALPSPARMSHTYYRPPYYGPIRVAPVGMAQPIFDEEQPVELTVTLLNSAPHSGDRKGEGGGQTNDGARGSANGATTLTYELFNEQTRTVMETNVVALTPEGKLDVAGSLKHGPLPQGAYRFRFDLMSGTNRMDRRDYEVVTVGPIQQRLVDGASFEDGLDLRKIWSVDCTAEPDTNTFLACTATGSPVETRVAAGPAGRYRELVETRRTLSMGYRFKHRRLFVPHLAVIEWPDDAPRSFQATILEGTSVPGNLHGLVGGYQRGDAVITHIAEHPLSGTMQALHLLYWPNEEDAAVHLWNVGSDVPPAVARITVYEILNDLPALRIADAGERMIGYHTERGPQTMSAGYYAGPLGASFTMGRAGVDHPEFYRNWYTTTENMIKRMRFSGQNMYLMGQFMYSTVLYPSRAFPFAQNAYRGGDANRDYAGLILRMFERNKMRMISSIEYIFTPDLLAESAATADEVRAGAPTLHQVHRDGTVGGIHAHLTGGQVNFFHPRVQQSVLTVVDELLELYAPYPAWRGINFILCGGLGGPIMQMNWQEPRDPLDWGYEDFTIDLFQKETGVRIPADPKSPDRFQKRYDWLMANARQTWIDWRCAQITKLYREIRNRMVKARPDLTLYITSLEPALGGAKPTAYALALDGHYQDADAIRQAAKTLGLDLETLRKEPGIVLSYIYSTPGCATTSFPKDNHMGWREAQHSDVWHDQFANDGKGGAFVITGLTHYPYYTLAKGQWIFDTQVYVRQGYFWPRYINDAFVNVLLRSNPTWMPHTWQDVAESSGRLHEMRLFARAYRSLPNGSYTRLTGNGLDRNVWVETTRAKGAIYGYAANPHWWPLKDVTLAFAAGAAVHDLIKDQPVKLKKGRWTFQLGPYDVQTFRVDGGLVSEGANRTSSVVGATVVLPETAAAALVAALGKGLRVVARARAKEADVRTLPGWKRVEEMEAAIAEIQRLQADGDICRAYTIANSWEFERRQKQVVKEALEAIPFLVLGPFGAPTDTGKSGNMEVIPNYQGMETPYLDELVSTNGTTLRANWAPDLGRTYPVCADKPGTPARWQETLNTYVLSFFGKCHSPYPLWMAAYAYTEVYSPETRQASIWVGSPHAIWAWANDRLVLKYGGHGTPRGGQRPAAPDQNRGNFRLQKGWNRILLKTVQRGQADIFFRLTDMDGNPMDDLKFRVPKAE